MEKVSVFYQHVKAALEQNLKSAKGQRRVHIGKQIKAIDDHIKASQQYEFTMDLLKKGQFIDIRV